MHRLALFALLFACRSATTGSGTTSDSALNPQSELDGSANQASVTLRLRGSSAGGVLIDGQFLAPGADMALTVAKGAEITVTAEPLMRAGAGGSRVLGWEGASHAYPVNESGVTTIVAEDILYVARFAQTDNIYALSFDGTQGRAVTHFTAPGLFIRSLAVSPNGEWLVYSSNRALGGGDATGPAANLWLQPAHAADAAVPLTRSFNADSTSPAWSPDSSALAFASTLPLQAGQTKNAFTNIWRIGIDGKGLSSVTALRAAWNDRPAFAPNGDIAFLSSRALSGDDATGPAAFLWIADASGPHWLTDIAASPIQAPVFTASEVAFAACDNLSCTMRSLAAVRIDGSLPRRLTALASSAVPAFAKAGDHLVALSSTALLTLDWSGGVRSNKGVALPLAVYAGPFFITETVDTTIPESDWHLNAPGFEKRYSVDSLGGIAVTPQ